MNAPCCHVLIDDLLKFIRTESGLVEGSDEFRRDSLIQLRLMKLREQVLELEENYRKTSVLLEAEIEQHRKNVDYYKHALTGMSRKRDAAAGLYPRPVQDSGNKALGADKKPKRTKRKLRVVK
jgi:hypothetical protein